MQLAHKRLDSVDAEFKVFRGDLFEAVDSRLAHEKQRHERDWASLLTVIEGVNKNYCEFRFRSFWGRLRWLLLGR